MKDLFEQLWLMPVWEFLALAFAFLLLLISPFAWWFYWINKSRESSLREMESERKEFIGEVRKNTRRQTSGKIV